MAIGTGQPVPIETRKKIVCHLKTVDHSLHDDLPHGAGEKFPAYGTIESTKSAKSSGYYPFGTHPLKRQGVGREATENFAVDIFLFGNAPTGVHGKPEIELVADGGLKEFIIDLSVVR